MRHTAEEIDTAARRFDLLANKLDPGTAQVERTDDLRQIASHCESVRADEVKLRDAVETARGNGRSWNQIAVALGVSRQAARQRFSDKAPA